MFFFLMILIANLVFFFYWLYKMLEEGRNILRTKLQTVYLWLCLCGDKERLEEEIRRRHIQDENEILREEFMRSNPLG